MSGSLFRGLRSASKYVNRSPVASATRLSTAFSDQSFAYHLPRRISDQGFHTSRYQSSEGILSDACLRSESIKRHQDVVKNGVVRQNGKAKTNTVNGLRSDETPISIYLESLPGSLSSDRRKESNTLSILQRIPKRAFHTVTIRRKEQEKDVSQTPKKPNEAEQSTSASIPEESKSGHEHFYDRIHMPHFHRPTKEELLAAATGFWSRFKVRFKWATIKDFRPFNMDEIVGFFSWIVLGHVLWIIIGTTTFFSLAILAINTVFAQETLAGWIGNYLTQSTGLKVIFESAVVPKWGDGVITFKNVFVSRRPGQNTKTGVRKGSPEEAAIIAAAEEPIPEEDQNYTQFDITLGEVNVTLSFNKWWNSKGLLQNVEIKHVRGVVDRTHVFWPAEQIDPKSYRHEHVPGDFEIESFKIEDLLVTLHQPKGFRPFSISIYNADLPRLRKHWLFYDFLCANSMTGEFDRSLFTIHQRQTHNFTGAQLNNPEESKNEPWRKQSRIRLDAMNIDHLNTGVEGPFSWIREGNVDIVADIMIPNDTDESVTKLMSDFYDRMEATLTSKKHLELAQATASGNLPNQIDPDPYIERGSSSEDDDKRFLIMDLRIHLNDVRAVVPLFTRDLSYINNALIRPIVAYINSRRTFIPINCRVVKRASDFDGSWTIYDSGLMDDLSAEVYDAFARDVTDEQARMRRFKKVGLWSLQLAVQAIFLGMAGNMA